MILNFSSAAKLRINDRIKVYSKRKLITDTSKIYNHAQANDL